jgi:predicted peptidase
MKNMSHAAIALAGILLAPPESFAAQPEAGKMIKVSPKREDLIPYWLYLPKEHATNTSKLPVVVFLHGMGERGNNLDRVLVHGPPKLIAKGKHFPFIMIAPQCPNDGRKGRNHAKSFWWHPEGPIDKVKNIVEFEKKRLGRIDADRIYITGLSMGGFGTYQIVSHHPDYFAAAAPICGHGNRIADKAAFQKAFADLPVWAFHGDRDNVVRLAEQQQTIKLLKAGGATIKFTVYPGVGHDSWTRTYNNPDFYKWLLSHKRAHKKDRSSK